MNRPCRSSIALAALSLALLAAACGGAVAGSGDGTGIALQAASAADQRQPEACPGLACDLDCSATGFALDSAGCPICECAGAAPCVCEDGTSCADDGSCSGGCPPLCDRFCPYGNRYDAAGCELCECLEAPASCTSDSDCAEGERCTPEESARAARICEPWIEPACECPYQELLVCGADGNEYPSPCSARCAGVEVAYEGPCQVRCPPLDCMPCPDGNLIGADGCATCECLPSVACDAATDPSCACDASDTDCTGNAPGCGTDADCGEGELCVLDPAGDATVAGHCEAAVQCRTAQDCEAGPQPVPACPIEWSCERGACIFACAS